MYVLRSTLNIKRKTVIETPSSFLPFGQPMRGQKVGISDMVQIGAGSQGAIFEDPVCYTDSESISIMCLMMGKLDRESGRAQERNHGKHGINEQSQEGARDAPLG